MLRIVTILSTMALVLALGVSRAFCGDSTNTSSGTQTVQAQNSDPFKAPLAKFTSEDWAQFYRVEGFCGNLNSPYKNLTVNPFPINIFNIDPNAHFD